MSEWGRDSLFLFLSLGRNSLKVQQRLCALSSCTVGREVRLRLLAEVKERAKNGLFFLENVGSQDQNF